MFCRQKFVTNSSSTSFIGFGIQVDRWSLICQYAKLKDTVKFYEIFSGYEPVDPEDRELFENDPVDWLSEHDVDWEFAEEYLTDKGMDFHTTPWGNIYLLIGYPDVELDDEGYVSVKPDCLKENFDLLNNMIKTLDLDKKIQVYEDCYQDY